RAAARREQADVDAGEAALTELLHAQVLAAKLHRLAGRARRREQPELLQRKLALLEALQELDTHGAGGADDRDDRICNLLHGHALAPKRSSGRNKKAPSGSGGASDCVA